MYRVVFKKLSLAAVLATSFATSANSQTVFTDDFSSGNPVVGTAYTLVAGGGGALPGLYRVVQNPATDFSLNGYSNYFDHTFGSAAGRMMFFDGASDQRAIWTRAATLTNGVSYTFSFWASSALDSNNPAVGFLLDGMPVGTAIATANATWRQFSYSFVATVSSVRTFSIVDLNTAGFGNDGALDDVLLTASIPEPSSTLLLTCGMIIIAIGVRRRSVASRGIQ